MIRFGKRGKLLLRFIAPFEILERVGTIGYWLALPPSMSGVHEVFYVSMIKKYTPDPAHIVDWREITVDTDGTFEEGPVRIIDSQDQVFKTQDREASESVVVVPSHGEGNVGARGHDAGILSLLV